MARVVPEGKIRMTLADQEHLQMARAKLEEGRTWTMDAAGLEQILGLPPWARQGEQAAK